LQLDQPPSGLRGRFLDDPALAGAENMARDEALLECRIAPTLRFYSWAKPTLSLGYFQKAADLPLDAVRARGGEVVRRMTGGKAILHEHELTYSLCMPESGALAGGPAAAMEAIHRAIAGVLSQQANSEVTLRDDALLTSDQAGSAWCFEDSSPLDLVLGGAKLLGSAARRRKGWVLFHGSLVLRVPIETPRIGALGGHPDLPKLKNAFSQGLGLVFAPAVWSSAEMEMAAAFRKSRYECAEYLHLR